MFTTAISEYEIFQIMFSMPCSEENKVVTDFIESCILRNVPEPYLLLIFLTEENSIPPTLQLAGEAGNCIPLQSLILILTFCFQAPEEVRVLTSESSGPEVIYLIDADEVKREWHT